MGNRYRRIVTLGMISFTALLAWGYCMLAYRSETLYVAIISLVLVASLYALALAVVELKDKKESAMRDYIASVMQDSKSSMDYTDYLETLERLAKASYVQQRKVNTYLGQQNEIVTDVMQEHTQAQMASFDKLQEQVDEAITKAVKILVKYNKSAGEKQIEATKELTTGMSEELTELTKAVGKITSVLQQMTMEIGYLKDAVQTAPKMTYMPEAAATAELISEKAILDETISEKLTAEETISEEMIAEETIAEETVAEETVAEETIPEEAISNEEVEEDEEVPDVEAILASLEKATEPIEQDEPVSDFNSEDFFSQFGGTEDASLKEEAAFKEEAMEIASDSNGMLDQSMIDALLGNLTAQNEKEEPLADVIPFPQTEEPSAVPPLDGDPNRQLTPEEIAALFSSMQ